MTSRRWMPVMTVLLSLACCAVDAPAAHAIPYPFIATGNKCQLDTSVSSRKGSVFAGIQLYNISHGANVGCQIPLRYALVVSRLEDTVFLAGNGAGRHSEDLDECYITSVPLCAKDGVGEVDAFAIMSNAFSGPYYHTVEVILALNEPSGGLPQPSRDPWVVIPPQCVIDPFDITVITCNFREPVVIEDFNSP